MGKDILGRLEGRLEGRKGRKAGKLSWGIDLYWYCRATPAGLKKIRIFNFFRLNAYGY
jgi:hypothetical protein